MTNPETDRRAGKSEEASKQRRTARTAAVSVVVIMIVATVAGIAIYLDRIAPFNTVVLEVNDTQIDMRYFLKRVAMTGEPPLNVLDTITREQMIKLAAGMPPFNIVVRREEIEDFARELAVDGGVDIDEPEFSEWYRQQLNETGLSDDEYRDLLRTALLSRRMEARLAEQVQTVADHVFLNMIIVGTPSIAETIKRRHDNGEGFADLAREYSETDNLAGNSGEVGWFPRGVLAPNIERVAFSIEIGRCSDPIHLDEQTVAIIAVTEKVVAREIDERNLAVLRSTVLDDWYSREYRNYEVQYHGFNNGYDSKTDAWVHLQLMRLRAETQERTR